MFSKIISHSSSLIQTLLSVLEFHQISRSHISHALQRIHVFAGRGLYRRLGLSPDPEDFIPYFDNTIPLYGAVCKSFYFLFPVNLSDLIDRRTLIFIADHQSQTVYPHERLSVP